MKYALSLFLGLMLVGCKPQDKTELNVGTIAGPETELVEVGAKVAKERFGLKVRIIEFSDYNLPNAALDDGSLDANVYQHLPYMKAANNDHGYTLKMIGKTFVYPMSVYSSRITQLSELKDGAKIALPNDPSNERRALLLLEKGGLITLKPNDDGSLHDIVKNPKNLTFIELDAAQLPMALKDVDAAVINTTFAMPAGLNPKKDGLLSEDKDSPYANIIVANEKNNKQEQLALFVKAMNSKEVAEKAKALFGDAAIPAFEVQKSDSDKDEET